MRPRDPERLKRLARIIREVIHGRPPKAVARREKVSVQWVRAEIRRQYARV